MTSYNSNDKHNLAFEQTPFFQNFARMIVSSFSEDLVLNEALTIHDIYSSISHAPLPPHVRHQLSEAFRYAFEHFANISDNSSGSSNLDSLTGFFTRRVFQSTFEAFQKEGAYPISLVSGDVNNLKLTNDVFGHDAGDRLLISIAAFMKTEASPDYKLFRVGGDEFYAILPRTTLEEANDYCSRVAATCNRNSSASFPISISLGASTTLDSTIDFRSLLSSADDAMYHVKTIFKDKSNLFGDVLQLLFDEGFLLPEIIEATVQMITAFAEYLKLDAETTSKLQLAARIQDIGLIAIPKHIVCKSLSLTEEETRIIRRHVESGYRLAKLYEESFPVASLILQSHEAWCGLGYPNRKKGTEISFSARVLYLVSAFITWIAPRPHGSAQSFELAYERLDERSGNQFDPELVEKFKDFLKTYPIPTF